MTKTINTPKSHCEANPLDFEHLVKKLKGQIKPYTPVPLPIRLRLIAVTLFEKAFVELGESGERITVDNILDGVRAVLPKARLNAQRTLADLQRKFDNVPKVFGDILAGVTLDYGQMMLDAAKDGSETFAVEHEPTVLELVRRLAEVVHVEEDWQS